MLQHRPHDVVTRGFTPPKGLPNSLRNGHVVVGNFDGVHLGHRALIDRASKLSARDGAPIVALTFEHDNGANPPVSGRRLTDRDEKLLLLSECGVDAVVTHVLGADDAHCAPELFVEEILARGLAAKSLIVGQNFRLGTSRNVAADAIADAAPKIGIASQVMPSMALGPTEQPVSSAAVQALIEAGDVKTANTFLGRRWTLNGLVVHGDKRGRQLGFPTANLALTVDIGLKFGVYAVRLLLQGRVVNGVACYGRRPQFDDGAPRLEVHLLDFDGDIYGQNVCIEFVDFQRSEKAFNNVDALVHQMTADCQDARSLLCCDKEHSAVVSVLDRRSVSPIVN